jgi:hypothetical protein
MLPLYNKLAIRSVVKFTAKHLLLFAQPVNFHHSWDAERACVANAEIGNYFARAGE